MTITLMINHSLTYIVQAIHYIGWKYPQKRCNFDAVAWHNIVNNEAPCISTKVIIDHDYINDVISHDYTEPRNYDNDYFRSCHQLQLIKITNKPSSAFEMTPLLLTVPFLLLFMTVIKNKCPLEFEWVSEWFL